MLICEKQGPIRSLSYLSLICILLAMLASLITTNIASAHGSPKPRIWHAIVGVASHDQATQGLVFLPNVLWVDAGDTVIWTARSGDIHTVTFLPPGQTPPPFTGSPNQVNRVGGDVYDGKGYFNSGLLSAIPVPETPTTRSYSLTFGVTGDFVYHCLVHPSMLGIIHVQPAGAPYPFSQQDYNKQIQAGTQTALHEGQKLTDFAVNHSNNHHVLVGIGSGQTSVVRFFPSQITVHVGDTVTFVSQDVPNAHTVSFGPAPRDENAAYGNPADFHGQPLSSGIVFFGQTFNVTFKKAGTFPFRCFFHDYLGMTITITVK
jgi:plastocyanin